MKFKAFIFDLDGTVIDSEWAWGQSLKNVLKGLGVDEKRKYPQVGGIGVPGNWKILKEKYHLANQKIEDLTEKTFFEFLKLIPRIKVMKGFKPLVKKTERMGIRLALATSTDKHIVEEVFKNLPIENCFEVVTTGEEVINRKPAPDIFLKAAQKLKLDPKDCLVFEDAQSGITAAHEAKMEVVALARDEEAIHALKDADMVVRNFSEFSF